MELLLLVTPAVAAGTTLTLRVAMGPDPGVGDAPVPILFKFCRSAW